MTAVAALLVVLVAGCALVPVPTPAFDDLVVANETPLVLGVRVNGVPVGEIARGEQRWSAARLPQRPWRVEIVTSSGRVLLGLEVNIVAEGSDGNPPHGAAARVDLSCGRVDVWVGVPMVGPMPALGAPGDCVP